MKKIFIVICLLFIVGCGNTKNVALDLNNSYHDYKSMEKAKNALIIYFKSYFDGCTLEKIWYDDYYVNSEKETQIKGNYDEVIVLKMRFKTDENQDSLASNSTYVYSATISKKNGEWSIIPGQVGF